MSISRSDPETRHDPVLPPRIADAATMRAMAHPVRLALLEALGRDEPLTATEAAAIVGESPSACSFHLRMLAKYGLVEADEAIGRRRPWRRKNPSGFVFPAVDDDPQTSLAAGALSDLVWGRLLDRARAVLAAGRGSPPNGRRSPARRRPWPTSRPPRRSNSGPICGRCSAGIRTGWKIRRSARRTACR